MPEKVLVTGGCGFLGSNVVRRLLAEGYKVTIIDDLSTGKEEYVREEIKNNNCEFIKGSITDLKFMKKHLRSIDYVIHEAADPNVKTSKEKLYEIFEINVRGTINVLQAMVTNEISKIIFASSAGTVYGESKVIPTPEETTFSPISHYGATKASAEQFMSSFACLYNFEAYSFRLGNIYGPPSNHGVIYDFYMKLKQNPTSLEILGNGLQTKSYLYVDDCVEAHIKAMNTTKIGHTPLNIASNTGTTVNEIADGVVDALELKDVKYTYTGGERGWEGDVKKAVVDISKAEKIIQWKPKISVKDGTQKYVNWMKKNRHN